MKYVSEFLDMMKNWSHLSIFLRLIFSVIAGVLIGTDRALKRRGAGIKTHVLVCMGAALVMLTGQFIRLNYEGTMDVARLGAQVISGVGFLGVGTIIVTGRNQVRGLTTAAGLWGCACIGLAIGIGFVDGAFIAVILSIFTLKVLNKADSYIHRYAKIFELYVEFGTNKNVSEFIRYLHEKEIKINNFEIGKSRIKGEGPNALLSVEVRDRKQRVDFVRNLHDLECIRYIEEV